MTQHLITFHLLVEMADHLHKFPALLDEYMCRGFFVPARVFFVCFYYLYLTKVGGTVMCSLV